jgi:hypothetical protein
MLVIVLRNEVQKGASVRTQPGSKYNEQVYNLRNFPERADYYP